MNLKDIYTGIVGNLKYYTKSGYTTQEIFEKRVEICRSCVNIRRKDDFNKMKCSLCGCPLKKKLILKNSKCKHNYWEEK